MGLVLDLEALPRSGKKDCVIAHDISPSDSMHSYLFSSQRHATSAMDYFGSTCGILQDGNRSYSRPAGGIFLLVMMGLDDLYIIILKG